MDLMVDIETLGTKPGCVVLEIGVVPFNDRGETGGQVSSWRAGIDKRDQQMHGLLVDTETLAWWGHPDRHIARMGIEADNRPAPKLHAALEMLSEYISFLPADTRIWANSPQFDLSIIKHLYGAVGYKVPWNFRQERDLRTLLDDRGYASCSSALVRTAEYGTVHRALDDARYQAAVAEKLFEKRGRTRSLYQKMPDVWEVKLPTPDARWTLKANERGLVELHGHDTPFVYDDMVRMHHEGTKPCPTCKQDMDGVEIDVYVRRTA